MRELHSRINDGIHVRLLWHEPDNRMAVANERAMDVFHHPYAYAAWHLIPTRPAVEALAALT